jgi:hypothetical protein
MDRAWILPPVRTILRKIFECGTARPFRPYYEWVSAQVEREARDGGFRNIVEMGAGTAPLTRLLAARLALRDCQLIPCDVNPDIAAYQQLAVRFPGIVVPLYTPVDLSERRSWQPATLLVLSASFHHVPPGQRLKVLEVLTGSAAQVMIFEPLQRRLSSAVFVFLSTVPALLLPIWFINRPGKLRRFVWCWIVPLAPIMFWWDGMI